MTTDELVRKARKALETLAARGDEEAFRKMFEDDARAHRALNEEGSQQ